MIKRFLLSLGVFPIVLVAAPVIASADTSATGSGMTITIPSSVNVIARVAADVPVSITCNAFDQPFLYGYSGNVSVTLSQASSKTVNSASGYLYQTLTCDGTAHSYHVTLLFSKPFHGGSAALTASGSQAGYDLQQFCYPWGCYAQYVYVQEQATVLGSVQLQ